MWQDGPTIREEIFWNNNKSWYEFSELFLPSATLTIRPLLYKKKDPMTNITYEDDDGTIMHGKNLRTKQIVFPEQRKIGGQYYYVSGDYNTQ